MIDIVNTPTDSDAIVEIDGLIESLLRKRRTWAEEIRNPKSDMKQSDLVFLDRQIKRLNLAKMQVNNVLDSVRESVAKHTKDW